MDLLSTGRFDGSCLVSSDSDFTRLAARIRQSGLTAYRFGERKTPKPFATACDKFAHIETPQAAAPAVSPAPRPGRQPEGRRRAGEPAPQRRESQLRRGRLGTPGHRRQHHHQAAPHFDSRAYGYAKPATSWPPPPCPAWTAAPPATGNPP
jgi:hypothetical protein